MLNTGYEKPTIEKEIIPNKLAKLSPSRGVGKTPIINTPIACEANTSKNIAVSIGPHPLCNGNALKPYNTAQYKNPINVKTTVCGANFPNKATAMESFPIPSHCRAVPYLISIPMLNTVTRNTINWITPGNTVLFRYTE